MYERGTQLVAYADRRPAERIYLIVTRKAKNGEWVDVTCHTWATMWTKRMPIEAVEQTSVVQAWSMDDLDAQMRDADAKRMLDNLGDAHG